ncbi:hypothetical protein BS47DRAFT_1361497 [Hydnum rufescens UP504]|uniref:Uncharacterized protein n=1 Tax=Hydnum rufescens UP504 TaxID=1448309 RepID=A0A9P6DXF2_9AGAM|nr:hypothetical protein BS47DRAFT_1361497 [Hydnum rufescens UP504]
MSPTLDVLSTDRGNELSVDMVEGGRVIDKVCLALTGSDGRGLGFIVAEGVTVCEGGWGNEESKSTRRNSPENTAGMGKALEASEVLERVNVCEEEVVHVEAGRNEDLAGPPFTFSPSLKSTLSGSYASESSVGTIRVVPSTGVKGGVGRGPFGANADGSGDGRVILIASGWALGWGRGTRGKERVGGWVEPFIVDLCLDLRISAL